MIDLNHLLLMDQPVICTIEEKLLVGMHTLTTLAEPTTVKMWKTFMPRRKEVEHQKGDNLLAVQIYPGDFNENGMSPNTAFVSCATVAVSQIDSIPEGMEKKTNPFWLVCDVLSLYIQMVLMQKRTWVFGLKKL